MDDRPCSTQTFGEKRNACRFVVGKSERKSPLEIPRLRWKDNVGRVAQSV